MTRRRTDDLPPVLTFPRDAVLLNVHLAAAFHTSEESVQKMDLPCTYIGTRPRYVWGQVIDTLTERANEATG
jgi:hypothetical protein